MVRTICAFALGLSVSQSLNWISDLKLSHLVKYSELEQLSAKIGRQGHSVGSCRDVKLSITHLGEDKIILLLKGLDWDGKPFGKAQLIHDEATNTSYALGSRREGDTLWIYRQRTTKFPPDVIDYYFTPHPIYGLQVGPDGRLMNLRTRSGRGLCGGFSAASAVKALPKK